MSLDLWVLKKDKISKELMMSIREFLTENDFIEDEYSYCSSNKDICVDIYIEQSPENDELWDDMDELIDAIGFFPKAIIPCDSKHTEESHLTNYSLAKQLAKLVDGVIYDHQIAVVYNSEGEPYASCRTDGKLEEYGSGISMFVNAVKSTEKIFKENGGAD